MIRSTGRSAGLRLLVELIFYAPVALAAAHVCFPARAPFLSAQAHLFLRCRQVASGNNRMLVVGVATQPRKVGKSLTCRERMHCLPRLPEHVQFSLPSRKTRMCCDLQLTPSPLSGRGVGDIRRQVAHLL